MKKNILVLMFCLPVFISNSYSQTKQESIRELLKVMHQESIIDKMYISVIPSMMSQIKSQFPANDSIANVRSNERMKSSMQNIKNITKKMLDEDMVEIYDKYFTQSEINDYIAFYKSPSGQKFILTTPDVSRDLMTIMMQKYMPEIRKSIQVKPEDAKNANKK